MLAAEGFLAIAGKRVGLVTNATGRARDGRSTVEVLTSPEAKKAGVTLVRLFSPEHGLRTDADARVSDQTDPETGLPVISLYGERPRPASAELADLDALVLDIQDVGTRFYTYITTGGYVLEEAAKAKVPLVVLDRPGPDRRHGRRGAARRSGQALVHRVSPGPREVRHDARRDGSSRQRGEKARRRRARRPMRGWSRDLWYDETGLEWINPSPNMRSLGAAALYPGVGLLETTNVSVGRGTDTPFEVLGAPWLDGGRLAQVLNARAIPGVRFSPLHFTPSASVFAGERCGGVRLDVVDREALRAVSARHRDRGRPARPLSRGTGTARASSSSSPTAPPSGAWREATARRPSSRPGRGTSTSSRSGARSICCTSPERPVLLSPGKSR